MESKPFGLTAEEVRPILTLASQADFAAALRDQRMRAGLTLADLDHIAGFHDGYAAHLESPFTRSGKKSFNITRMGLIWLDALGLSLCLAQRTPERTSGALGRTGDP